MSVTHTSFRGVVLVTGLAMIFSLPIGARAEGTDQGGHRGDAISQELSLAERAALRHPQPVRVGDLLNRQVLEPSIHQGVLGRVAGVSREIDGSLVLVFRYGGLLGFGTRLVAVPIEATALLGQFMQVTDVAPAQIAALPTWTGAGAAPLGKDEVIRVGINRN